MSAPGLRGARARRHRTGNPERRERGGRRSLSCRPPVFHRHRAGDRPHARCGARGRGGHPRDRDGGRRRITPRGRHERDCARAGTQFMNLLQTLIAFVVALGVLIVVHEYGHYIVARLCGVKVLRFSVGFGRPLALWRRGADRTEWVIAAVPFGGYVKMLDEREGPVAPEEVHRAFNRQSVWRRFLIVVAGPVFNFIFAILVYAGLFMYGLPEARPVLGDPPAGTVAASAGLRSGDTVRAVDGSAITTWQELRWRVLQTALQRQTLRLEIENERGHLGDVTLDLRSYPADEVEADALDRVGLRLYRPPLEPIVGQIVSGGPADRAGLAVRDRVVRADGKPIETWDALVNVIRARPGKPLSLLVERSS